MRHLVVSARHSSAGVQSGLMQIPNMIHRGCLFIIFLLMGSIGGKEVRCLQDGVEEECAAPTSIEQDKETVEVEVEVSGIEVEVEVEFPVECKTNADLGKVQQAELI